jgi:hypothetical protein
MKYRDMLRHSWVHPPGRGVMITTIKSGSREEIEAVAAYVKELSGLAEDD